MPSEPVYRQSQAPIETRIADLLARMTREEKIGQLGQVCIPDFLDRRDEYLEGIRAGRWGSRILAATAFAGNDSGPGLDVAELNAIQRVAIEESRLGIPLLFGRDVIYGHRTVFPIPHSQAASFDPDLVERCMAATAAEASAEGVQWTFSPMLDLVRDPRWGRVIESYGEDPFLLARMGAAAVRGFQGPDPSAPDRLLACAKHFAGYGGAEAGRDYDTAEWTENTLHNMVLPPFRSAAEAGVATVMAGFNDLGGTPVSASETLLRGWLKDTLGWQGFAVSDWGSIFDLIGHRVAEDDREAARLGFRAGIDMEMTAGIYERELPGLLDSGAIPPEWLDDAVARILRAKFRAGLFDNPYTDPDRAAKVLRAPAHVALAEELATRSAVLLKNDGILPLHQALGKVAVLGPFAEARREHLGSWCLDGRASDVTTILDGLRRAAPRTEFTTAPAAFSDAMVDAARSAEIAVLCLGESHVRNGENRSIAHLALPPGQEAVIEAIADVGVPIVVVDCSGRYLPIPAAERRAAAILHAGVLGTEAGTAIARLLTGQANPSGKLPISIPRATGQIPIYYNRKSLGKIATFSDRYRGHEDLPRTPLYPFGFGLSYSRFTLERPALSATELAVGDTVEARIRVRNDGPRAGAEVVQMYIQDVAASTARPERELKAFARVELQPGDETEVRFPITAETLAFYNADRRWTPEPGRFRVGLGNSSTCPLDLELDLLEPPISG